MIRVNRYIIWETVQFSVKRISKLAKVLKITQDSHGGQG